MPSNNSRTRKAWRKAMASENAFYRRILDEILTEALNTRREGVTLGRQMLELLAKHPAWVDARDRSRDPRP